MVTRSIKQLVIAIIVFGILGAIGYSVIHKMVTRPTCSDDIQNQGEDGIDCGDICLISCFDKYGKSILVQNEKLLNVRDLEYAYLFEVVNPNFDFGASQVSYEISFLDNSELVTKKTESFFILPGQTRPVIGSFIRLPDEADSFMVEIKNIKWKAPENIDISKALFSVVRKEYNKSDKKIIADIYNSSNYSFEKVEVNVVLYYLSEVVAVTKTEIRTFLAGTERHFEIALPSEFSRNVSKIEVYPVTNIFSNSNFFKQTPRPTETFQSF